MPHKYHYWDDKNNCRKVAYYKRLKRTGPYASIQYLACSHCDLTANSFNQGKEKRSRVCHGCGYALRKRPSITRRQKTDEALLHEAQKKIEDILSDIGRKMTSLKKHQKRVKRYTAKLEGRLKKSTPKKSTPIRKITVA